VHKLADAEWMPGVIGCFINEGFFPLFELLKGPMKAGAKFSIKVGFGLIQAVQNSGLISTMFKELLGNTPAVKDVKKIYDEIQKVVVKAVSKTCAKSIDEMTGIGKGKWPKKQGSEDKLTEQEWCEADSVQLDDFLFWKELFKATVPAFIKWLYGVIDKYILEPIEVEIMSVIVGVMNDLGGTIDGICGIAPEVGGVICDVVLNIALFILDTVIPQALHSLYSAVKLGALKLVMTLVPKITNPLVDKFVDLIHKGVDTVSDKVDDAASKGAGGDYGGAELKVLMDLFLPMIEHMAEELIFPKAGPERTRCRIRLRKLRGIVAPDVCADHVCAEGKCNEGTYNMPPKETLENVVGDVLESAGALKVDDKAEQEEDASKESEKTGSTEQEPPVQEETGEDNEK